MMFVGFVTVDSFSEYLVRQVRSRLDATCAMQHAKSDQCCPVARSVIAIPYFSIAGACQIVSLPFARMAGKIDKFKLLGTLPMVHL